MVTMGSDSIIQHTRADLGDVLNGPEDNILRFRGETGTSPYTPS